ncbi:3-hydroxy-3-methylglutaryl-coenzyme A reductase [archaeon HR06]|nr:3-hydroxy-3-methylglutaryl-coenzyme A reductase [archaeon HR06]
MKLVKDFIQKSSNLPGFYKLTPEERLKIVKDFSELTDEDIKLLKKGLSLEEANRMIENVIGGITLPLGIAVNFLINGKDYLIPMAIEEPSVVAAASHAAKIARVKGGFEASNTGSFMVGQIQITDLKDPYKAREKILEIKEDILKRANEQAPTLNKLGGGAKDLETKILDTPSGKMLIVELIVDCKDAMGANIVNTMAEKVSPLIENLVEGKILLRIVSNFATKRLVRAKAIFDKEALGGEEVVEGIIKAYHFALTDIYRCVTHNKGIMNGIIAVALATGQDTRAIEAAAHAYACKSGKYLPLTHWEKDEEGNLRGSIELPLAVGIVGGSILANPLAKLSLKILRVKSSLELAEVMGSVGLAQNLAALRALVKEGIQRGHMRLHDKNIAIMAGAKGELIDIIAKRMIDENWINYDRAKELLKELSN